jgi:hypothetical protein
MFAKPVVAQSVHPFATDVTIGAGTGQGGHYFDRTGLAAEVTLVPEHEKALIAAFTVGARGTMASGDICAFEGPPPPNGQPLHCLDRFPTIVHLGVLGGLEHAGSFASVRAIAGPALYGGSTAFGLGGQFQLDAAAGFTHLAVVAAVRGSLIARPTADPLRLNSLQFGLRVR